MKFFLFRREAVSLFSETKSNTGDGISVFGVPATSLANLSATEGVVHLVFNDAGNYDSYTGASTQGLEKVQVSLTCTVGEEFELIREIMEFIGSDSKKTVMIMDSVSGFSTFPRAASGVVLAIVPVQPVTVGANVLSQDPASTDRTGTNTTNIAGVTFPVQTQRPTIDYNHEGLAALSAADRIGSVNTWDNAGTSGATNDITADTGAPLVVSASNGSLLHKSVGFDNLQAAHLGTRAVFEKDFTMYMVYSIDEVRDMYQIFGSNATASKGFGNGTTENKMFFTFDGNTGDPAIIPLNTTDYKTKAAKVQDPRLDDVGGLGEELARAQLCYVWVIRRDKDLNLIVHDYTGDVVGYLPAKVGGAATNPGRTDGDLSIDRLGGDGTNTLWKGNIARFGVVDTDIGRSEAARIARELFDTYNLYSF